MAEPILIDEWECLATVAAHNGEPLRVATRRGRMRHYYMQLESSGRLSGNGGDIGVPPAVVAWLVQPLITQPSQGSKP